MIALPSQLMVFITRNREMEGDRARSCIIRANFQDIGGKRARETNLSLYECNNQTWCCVTREKT